jgi:alkylation response protein AidB-like acyl-CoA dehydrogenase
MDLELTPDQTELRAVARGMLDQHAPFAVARSFLEGNGTPDALWDALRDLGWYAIGLGDDDVFGNAGLCLLAEAVGAHAAPTLLVDTAVAARLLESLDAGGDPLVDRILAGEATAAVAVLETRDRWDAREPATAATPADDGALLLDGKKLAVRHGARADVLVVTASLDGELALALLEADARGVTTIATPGLDPAAGHAVVTLDGVRVNAGRWWTGPALAEAYASATAVGALAAAAEGIGAASRALDIAIEYAKERKQFGRPIGSFQAVQHLLADAHILRETAWASVLYAAGALDEGLPDAAEAASIAKAHVSRASRAVVEAALQAFGGIGFTMEHDVHLLQRRVLEEERRFGDAADHERRLGDLLARRARDGVNA